jgi:phage terminase Nu1 subunit (DNA packaging protein)
MNLRQLAQALHVSETTVAVWVKKGVPHRRTKTGAYHFDPKAVATWRTLHVRPQPSADAPSYGSARARKETALAGLRELQLKERTGELVRKEAVEKVAFATGRRLRDGFLNLPNRLAGILAAERDQHMIHTLLTKEIEQILEALSHGEP